MRDPMKARTTPKARAGAEQPTRRDERLARAPRPAKSKAIESSEQPEPELETSEPEGRGQAEPSPDLAALAGRILLRKLITLVALVALLVGGAIGIVVLNKILTAFSGPDAPDRAAFKVADERIAFFRGEAAFGNTPEAQALARAFSSEMAALQELSFEGGADESTRVSLTRGEFLTHCQVGPRGVCFLVHVPQLKRYKGDVREELLSLAWLAANAAARDLPGKGDRELAVALRGAVMYGATATGRLGAQEPTSRELASSVSESPLYPFFAPAAATVAAGSTPGQ